MTHQDKHAPEYGCGHDHHDHEHHHHHDHEHHHHHDHHHGQTEYRSPEEQEAVEAIYALYRSLPEDVQAGFTRVSQYLENEIVRWDYAYDDCRSQLQRATSKPRVAQLRMKLKHLSREGAALERLRTFLYLPDVMVLAKDGKYDVNKLSKDLAETNYLRQWIQVANPNDTPGIVTLVSVFLKHQQEVNYMKHLDSYQEYQAKLNELLSTPLDVSHESEKVRSISQGRRLLRYVVDHQDFVAKAIENAIDGAHLYEKIEYADSKLQALMATHLEDPHPKEAYYNELCIALMCATGIHLDRLVLTDAELTSFLLTLNGCEPKHVSHALANLFVGSKEGEEDYIAYIERKIEGGLFTKTLNAELNPDHKLDTFWFDVKSYSKFLASK